MKIRTITKIAAILLLAFACGKEETIINNNYFNTTYPPAKNYFPLEIGNTWVYNQYSCNSTNDSCWITGMDSVEVIKDTLIGNDTFFVVSDSYLSPNKQYLKDSAEYILNKDGHWIFTTNQALEAYYTNIAYLDTSNIDTLFEATFKLAEINNAIHVPAGVFVTHNFQGCYFSDVNGFEERFNNNYYAKNVGLVKETTQYLHNSTNYIKRELVSYTLN